MEKSEHLIKLQFDHMNNDIHNQEREKIHQSWFDFETVDYWRHDRFYSTIEPLASYYKAAKWLTLGDGRYGLDSIKLKNKYGINALPSDLSENMLTEAQRRGLIDEFKVENIENLSFENNSFDVLFCKEAFHHLPRPMIGLYEMIRVAKELVILIEPFDCPKKLSLTNREYLKNGMKILFNKFFKKNFQIKHASDNYYYEIHDAFETSGNYTYGINVTEINKIVHALDLAGFAFLPFNDTYKVGVEFEKATEEKEMFKYIKRHINLLDKQGVHNTCTIVLFKNQIAEPLRILMKKNGFVFPTRHLNPYI
jgi:ubiquinone/menaquinone biosynthesis C-methylase UbiE